MLVVQNPNASDLEKFQVQVAQIATKYAKKHNWCSEVNNALKEMGIDPAVAKKEPTYAKIAFSINAEVIVPVDENSFAGLSEIEQTILAAELIKNNTIQLDASSVLTSGTVVVTEIENSDQVPVLLVLRDGYAYKYVSEQGRVRHICVASSSYSLCSDYCTTTQSNRDNGQVCKKCTERYQW